MEDMEAPEEVTLSQGKQEAHKLRKTERENQTRVAIQAKQRRNKQAMKKVQSRLQLENKVRGTAKHARLGKGTILSEQQQDIHSPEGVRSRQIPVLASREGQENPDDPNREGMLPDSIVDFLAGREKEHQLYSTETIAEDPTIVLKPKKKKMSIKHGNSGSGRVRLMVLNDASSSNHVRNAKEFQQNRQLQVRRSSAVLQHANRAFSFLSKQGLLPSRQILGCKQA